MNLVMLLVLVFRVAYCRKLRYQQRKSNG